MAAMLQQQYVVQTVKFYFCAGNKNFLRGSGTETSVAKPVQTDTWTFVTTLHDYGTKRKEIKPEKRQIQYSVEFFLKKKSRINSIYL